MNRVSWSLGTASLLAVAACDPLAGTGDGSDGVEAVAASLLSGARSVSNLGAFTDTSWESETTSAQIGTSWFVGYNAGHPQLTQFIGIGGGHEDRKVCRNTSQMSYSQRDPATGAWARIRLPPPPGIAVLWGDPAMTAFRNRVFFSNLVIPNDRFDAAVADPSRGDNGCLRFTDSGVPFPSGMSGAGVLAGACIHRLNGSVAQAWTCFRKGNDFFDGGSLSATTSFVYAAYRNIASNTLALYRGTEVGDFIEMTLPPGLPAVTSHVMLVSEGPLLFLLWATGQTLSLFRLDETTNTLSGPVTVTLDFNRQFAPMKDANGQVDPNDESRQIRFRGFDMKLLPTITQASLIGIFYQRRVGSTQFTTLRGAICDQSLSCSASTALQPPNSSNNFMPSIGSVIVQPTSGPRIPHHFVSYWSDSGQTSTLALRVAEFTTNSFSAHWVTGEDSPYCRNKPDYWGDYDTSIAINSGTPHPTLSRLLTDSTGGPCDSRDYRSFPHHVSELPVATF